MALVRADQTPANPVKRPDADVPNDILRDRWGRPLIVMPDGKVEAYTRASSIGSVLEDQTGLGIWKMRAAMWAIGQDRALRLRASSIPNITDSACKEELRKLSLDALAFANTKAAADVGTALHALTERVDKGLPIPDLEEEQAAIEAYIGATRGKFVFHGTEQFVVCDRFKVAGTFDRIAEPLVDLAVTDRHGRPILDADGAPVVVRPGDRVVWDLKTSGSSKYFGIKFAAQLAAYAHGVRYRGWHTLGEDGKDVVPRDATERERIAATCGERLPWPDGIAPRTDWALILHVPQGGPERPGDPAAQLFWVNLAEGVRLLELATQVQAERNRRDLVVPATFPVPPMDTALNGAGLASLIDAVDPPTRAAFKRLWLQHRSAWTDEHTARVEKRMEDAS